MLNVGDFQSMTFTGTLYYFSPEMYHQGKATFTTDIWLVNHLLRLIYNLANIFNTIRSLGCVIYELKLLKKAFPRGQIGNPSVPDLTDSLRFAPFLTRFF